MSKYEVRAHLSAFVNMLLISIPTPTSFFSSTSSLADILKELDDAYEKYRRESDSLQRRKLQLSIQRALIRSQELGDEKIQIVGQMVRKERAPCSCYSEAVHWQTSRSQCVQLLEDRAVHSYNIHTLTV